MVGPYLTQLLICVSRVGDTVNGLWFSHTSLSMILPTHSRVSGDVISGLRYNQGIYRKGIRVAKERMMMGSYGPKEEDQFYQTPLDEVPHAATKNILCT